MSTHINAPSNTPSGLRKKLCGTMENGKLVAMLHIWRNNLNEKCTGGLLIISCLDDEWIGNCNVRLSVIWEEVVSYCFGNPIRELGWRLAMRATNKEV